MMDTAKRVWLYIQNTEPELWHLLLLLLYILILLFKWMRSQQIPSYFLWIFLSFFLLFIFFYFFSLLFTTQTPNLSFVFLTSAMAKFTKRWDTCIHRYIVRWEKITIKSDWMAVNKFGMRSILQTLVFSIHQFGACLSAPDKLLYRDIYIYIYTITDRDQERSIHSGWAKFTQYSPIRSSVAYIYIYWVPLFMSHIKVKSPGIKRITHWYTLFLKRLSIWFKGKTTAPFTNIEDEAFYHPCHRQFIEDGLVFLPLIECYYHRYSDGNIQYTGNFIDHWYANQIP